MMALQFTMAKFFQLLIMIVLLQIVQHYIQVGGDILKSFKNIYLWKL